MFLMQIVLSVYFLIPSTLGCMINLYKCLLVLLMHKMGIWKTHDMNLLCFPHKKPSEKTSPQKMPEEVIKNIKKRKEFERTFLLQHFFLVLCKFRMVKWKQEGRKRGTIFTPWKLFPHSSWKFIAAWQKFWDFSIKFYALNFYESFMNFSFWFIANFDLKTISKNVFASRNIAINFH